MPRMQARFFRSDAMAERLGEVDDFVFDNGTDSFQLTYNQLRDMDGDFIATFDHIRDVWVCEKNGVEYSDVVIYNTEIP